MGGRDLNREIWHMFKQDKRRKDLLILIQILLSYILITSTFYLLIDTTSNYTQLINTTKTLHKMTDNFIGREERLFFAQPDNVMILKNFYNWLNENEQFTYIIASRQGFYMDENTYPDKFKDGYEDGMIYIEEQYKSRQVNAAFFDHFSIDVSEGRLFEFSDYDIENEIIPILLGYEFRDYAYIGELLDFYYCHKSLVGKVIGFLQKESYYNNGYNIENLDRFILMPALQSSSPYAPIVEENKSFELKVYLDNVSGFISSNLAAHDIQRMITQKSLELNIVPYQLERQFAFYLSMWGMEGEQLQTLFTFSSIFMIIIACMSISMNIANKIQDMKKDIAIYIINGLSIKNIRQNIFIYILYINSFGACISGLLWFFLSGRLYLIQLSILLIINVCIQFTYPYGIIGKLNISKSIKGGE